MLLPRMQHRSRVQIYDIIPCRVLLFLGVYQGKGSEDGDGGGSTWRLAVHLSLGMKGMGMRCEMEREMRQGEKMDGWIRGGEWNHGLARYPLVPPAQASFPPLPLLASQADERKRLMAPMSLPALIHSESGGD